MGPKTPWACVPSALPLPLRTCQHGEQHSKGWLGAPKTQPKSPARTSCAGYGGMTLERATAFTTSLSMAMGRPIGARWRAGSLGRVANPVAEVRWQPEARGADTRTPDTHRCLAKPLWHTLRMCKPAPADAGTMNATHSLLWRKGLGVALLAFAPAHVRECGERRGLLPGVPYHFLLTCSGFGRWLWHSWVVLGRAVTVSICAVVNHQAVCVPNPETVCAPAAVPKQ